MVKPGGFYRHQFKQGEDYAVSIPLQYVSGNLIDTTGMVGQSQIRTLDGELMGAFTITFPATGYARFALSRAITEDLVAKRYLSDAAFTSADDLVSFRIDGDVVVLPGQTQGIDPPPPPDTDQGNALYSNAYPAGASLSALRVARLNADGELDYASSAVQAHAFTVLGLLTSAITTEESARVLQEGGFADESWTWTLGTPIWLGVDGVLTQTPPESGFLLQVAIPKTATSIEFEIQEPVML